MKILVFIDGVPGRQDRPSTVMARTLQEEGHDVTMVSSATGVARFYDDEMVYTGWADLILEDRLGVPTPIKGRRDRRVQYQDFPLRGFERVVSYQWMPEALIARVAEPGVKLEIVAAK